MPTFTTQVEVNTIRDKIYISATNLLDIRIVEEFKEILESNINHIDFLNHLQEISRNGLKK